MSFTLASELPRFEVGHDYIIMSVEAKRSPARQFAMFELIAGDLKTKTEVSEALWQREVVGKNSKLGSFAYKLGKDISAWKGKKFKVVRWAEGKREIALI